MRLRTVKELHSRNWVRRRKNTRHFLSSSCGNDSVAMLVKALRDKVPNLTVIYSQTGWGSKDWPARVALVRKYCLERGVPFVEVGGTHTFQSLIRERKGFPMPGKTWCSLHLKAVPFLMWADEADPKSRAVVMIGKRRDESFSRRETPEFIASSEHHGDRKVWHPLAFVVEAERDQLLISAGFEVLEGRSRECSPCVNANRTDMRQMDERDIAKTIDLEKLVDQNMFRPHHHMGANGFAQVIKWAHSPRGKYEPPEVVSGCTEGYCE